MSEKTPSPAEQAITAVRAIHRQTVRHHIDGIRTWLVCAECEQLWPCRTVALCDAISSPDGAA